MDIKELQALAENIFSKKIEVDAADKVKKELQAQLKELETEAIKHLEAHGLKSFDAGAGIGKIGTTVTKSVKIEDKYAFFDWLKSKDAFESTVTITSTTASKIYREELDLAKLEGDVDFLANGIPGLSQPSEYTRLNKRGNK